MLKLSRPDQLDSIRSIRDGSNKSYLISNTSPNALKSERGSGVLDLRNIRDGSLGRDWLPSDLANLVAWYDPNDPDNIVQSGGLVSQLTDKSGNGNNLIQGNPSFQPDYNTSGDYKNLYFDGSDGMVTSISLPSSGNALFTFISEPSSCDNVENSIISLNATNDFQFDSANASQFDARINTNVATSVTSSNGPWTFAYRLFGLLFDFDTNTMQLYINGTKRGEATDYNTKLDVSQTLALGVNRAQAIGYRCYVDEIVINESTSTDSRQKIEGYIAHKRGLESVLPVDHPYKNNSPMI